MFGVVWISAYLFGSLSQTRNALDNRWALQAFLFVVFGIYFVWFWSKGQTLAMKTWRIRVLGPNGRAVSQGRAMARYGLSWLWFLPPLAAAWGASLGPQIGSVAVLAWVVVYALASRALPDGQFLHDVLAGTRLVDARAIA